MPTMTHFVSFQSAQRLPEGALVRWDRERRRLEAVAVSSDERLSRAQRAEVLRLRRQLAQQGKGLITNEDVVEA